MPSTLRYRFGEFELDLALFELRRRGRVLKIDPRAFALLHYLVAHADRVVLKEELMAEVWPDVVVSPSVLPTSIRRVRAALGQSAKESSPIRTVHRRGYRLNMPVQRLVLPCSRRGLSEPAHGGVPFALPELHLPKL